MAFALPASFALLLPLLGAPPQPCPDGTAGLRLPPGFCATVFADSLAAPRHVAVAPNGVVYVALRGSRGATPRPGGVIALRDADGDGRAEVQRTLASGFSATEAVIHRGRLYTASDSVIFRYPVVGDGLALGRADTVARGLPTGGHGAKTFAVGRRGELFVNVGSRSNACQQGDRQPRSPGIDPCTELETRAGIWRFDAEGLGQTQATAPRWATGIRNAIAIAVHPRTGRLWVVQHGRDQLSANWPGLFSDTASAETPSEELFEVARGDDFGWPYCYHDAGLRRKVLAPEYGGDGRQAGRCAAKKGNAAAFPAHWAPNALLFHSGRSLPARFAGGAFIAFHGSWNRAPLPQAGANVVFLPMRDGRPSGAWETFADGFATAMQPSVRGHRPTGLAEGPDGSLYVTDDAQGRVWRIRYVGPR